MSIFSENQVAVVSNFIDNKLIQNSGFIKITFYEVRVKLNLNEDESNQFIELAKNKLENVGYEVHFKEGEKYTYKDANTEVHTNELLVAFKR